MTPKTIKVWTVVGGVLGGGLGITILGLAMQFWIVLNVEAEVKKIVHPIDEIEAAQLVIDVATIKTTVTNINKNVDTAVASQERFEEQFIDYLQGEAQ